MRPSSAKAKGRKLQQIVRDIILKHFPSLTDKDVKSTIMGESGIDVQLSEAARKLFPWAVECKNYAKIVVYTWWDQATKASEDEGLAPLLVIKANLKEPLACIRLEDFIKLTKGYDDGKFRPRPVHGHERDQDAHGSTGAGHPARNAEGADRATGSTVQGGYRRGNYKPNFEVHP